MWKTVTKVSDNGRGQVINIPGTMINMDRIVQIIPRRNDGCTLITETGNEIKVLDLLNHFDNSANYVDYEYTAQGKPKLSELKEEPKPEVDLHAQIVEALKNSIRGPNSEIKKRIQTMIREIMEEGKKDEVDEPSAFTPPPPSQRPVKPVANSTRNIMG